MHGCCKEIDGAVGITLRLLFDYYRKKPRTPCAARLPRFFFKMPKICAIMIKPLRRSGFRLDGLITPTPKAAGSNPVGHTKKKDMTKVMSFFLGSAHVVRSTPRGSNILGASEMRRSRAFRAGGTFPLRFYSLWAALPDKI